MEVAGARGYVIVRDSKDPDGTPLYMPVWLWRRVVLAVWLDDPPISVCGG
ncbi:DUF397 domain-containing protein [Spirillospora sp. NBC_00431]